MQRNFLIIMVVLTLALASGLYSQSESDFEVKPNPDGRTMTIIAFKGTVKTVSIPRTVVNLPVTIIDANVFAGKELTSVSIPDTVTTINEGAFKNNRITTVTFGTGLQNINKEAFANNRINELKLPLRLQIIGERAFENNQLYSLSFPNTIKIVEAGAFAKNPLVAVILPPSLARRNRDPRQILLAGLAGGGDARVFGPDIISITVPNGMDQTVLEENFDKEFVDFWILQKKVPAAYIKRGAYWLKVANAERDKFVSEQIPIRREADDKRTKEEDARYAAEKAQREAEEKAKKEAEEALAKAEAAAQTKRELDTFNTALQRSGYTANILQDGSIEVTGYSVKGTTITIPASIGGKTVTRIAENAFRAKVSNGEIVTVIIPITVVEIGKNAFANTTDKGKKGKSKLVKVTWGMGLKKIEELAFADNTSLVTVVAGTSQAETSIAPSSISREFMLAWLGGASPKTYTKKGNNWE